MTNEYQANSERAWQVLTIGKSTWTPFNHRYSHRLYSALYKKSRLSMLPVSIALPSSRLQGSYAPSWKYFKLNIFIFVSSRVLSPHHTWHYRHACYFNATRDDKINNCGFKFSVVCQWHVLIEEDKNNLLQFAKVLPTKFLKLPIRQSFTPLPFCAIQYIFKIYSNKLIHAETVHLYLPMIVTLRNTLPTCSAILSSRIS